MKYLTLFVITLALLPAGGAGAAEPDRQALHKAAFLPTVSLQFGFGLNFGTAYGFELAGQAPDAHAEIAAVRKTMKGDASDAERWSRLADLYGETKEEALEKEANTKAAALYRERLKTHPDDGGLLAGLGEALQGLNQHAEAERVLRQGTTVAANDWRPWRSLGGFLMSQAGMAFFDKEKLAKLGPQNIEGPLPELLNDPRVLQCLKPDGAKQAEKLWVEAGACYDRAVVLAPREPDVYLSRAMFRVSSALAKSLFSLTPGNMALVFAAMFSRDSMRDLWQAASLRKTDPRAYLVAGTAAILVGMVEARDKLGAVQGPMDLWQALPEECRAQVEQVTARLEALSQTADKPTAAACASGLGMLYFLRQDKERCEASLRKAITLDPAPQEAWDLMAGVLFSQQRWNDMVTLFQDELRTKNTGRNHLLLAKALDKAGRPADAEKEVAVALNMEPDDVTCNLAWAGMLLRKEDAGSLSEAGRLLIKAAMLRKDVKEKDEAWADLTLLQAIHAGLSGQADKARALAKQVLAEKEDSEKAKAVLAALGE